MIAPSVPTPRVSPPTSLVGMSLGGGRYAVLWKVPAATYDAVRLSPQLPARCQELDAPAKSDDGVAIVHDDVLTNIKGSVAPGAVAFANVGSGAERFTDGEEEWVACP